MLTTLCDIINPEPCTIAWSVAPDGARADNSSWSYHRLSCVVNRRFAKGIPAYEAMPARREAAAILAAGRGEEFDSQLRAGMTSMHAPWTGFYSRQIRFRLESGLHLQRTSRSRVSR